MKKREDIEHQLRQAVLESSMSGYQIANRHISDTAILFFMNNRRSLTLPVAARLVEALRLELRPKKRK